MNPIDKLRNIENLHIILWLVKDACWVLLWRPLGMFMVLPTIAVAVYLTIKFWADLKERLHNMAVCCWILANSTWMTGEFFFNDSWRAAATVFFTAGIGCVSTWYILSWIRSFKANKV